MHYVAMSRSTMDVAATESSKQDARQHALKHRNGAGRAEANCERNDGGISRLSESHFAGSCPYSPSLSFSDFTNTIHMMGC